MSGSETHPHEPTPNRTCIKVLFKDLNAVRLLPDKNSIGVPPLRGDVKHAFNTTHREMNHFQNKTFSQNEFFYTLFV